MMIIAAVALLGCSTGDPYVPESDPVLLRANRRIEPHADLLVVPEAGTRVYPNIENFLEGPNPALALYRENMTRERVVEFFVEKTGSEEIALPILYYADKLDISLTLAFSLAWTESRFLPTAVNYNRTSIDRGVFQLNSLTFRSLTEEDFFNPEVNAFYGLRYLEFCLNQGADDAQALAIYNAGLTRVIRGQTPATTIRYTEQVLAYRAALTAEFTEFILSQFPPAIA
jgi:soluble lytic murein transglycosylase-like protein